MIGMIRRPLGGRRRIVGFCCFSEDKEGGMAAEGGRGMVSYDDDKKMVTPVIIIRVTVCV